MWSIIILIGAGLPILVIGYEVLIDIVDPAYKDVRDDQRRLHIYSESVPNVDNLSMQDGAVLIRTQAVSSSKTGDVVYYNDLNTDSVQDEKMIVGRRIVNGQHNLTVLEPFKPIDPEVDITHVVHTDINKDINTDDEAVDVTDRSTNE